MDKYKLCIEGDLGFEFWKDIPGYKGVYQESTYGRTKSLERIVWKPKGGYYTTVKERILTPYTDDWGYSRVKLSNNGGKGEKVHILVAKTFLMNPNSLPMVNHKDENKQNNCVQNLEYCDCLYNANYGTRNARIAEALKRTVLQFDINGNFIREWRSSVDVERELGFPRGTISHRCDGTRKSYKGYIWKYKDAAI